MSAYTMSVTLDRPFDEPWPAVRESLRPGFGVLTRIDVPAPRKAMLTWTCRPWSSTARAGPSSRTAR